LSDEHQLVAQLLNAFARRLVFVDAGEPEVAQGALHVVLRFRIRAADVEAVDGVVDAAIEREPGRQSAGFLRNAFGGLAERFVGMHDLDEPCLRCHRVQLQRDIVVLPQCAVDRWRRLCRGQPSERVACMRQASVHGALERRDVRHPGPERHARRADRRSDALRPQPGRTREKQEGGNKTKWFHEVTSVLPRSA
jgi:hypothetical protein